ncbi:hypothetical protein pb186bvf_008555 [Paramecium bursaria]
MTTPQGSFSTTEQSLDQQRMLSKSDKMLPPYKVLQSPSTFINPLSSNKNPPKKPSIGELIDLNKRIQILSKRKAYILQFYQTSDSNRCMLNNNNYRYEVFNEYNIGQYLRNWHYYEGQGNNGQFDGYGTMHFDDVRVHGFFRKGVADGKISIFKNNQLYLIAEYKGGVKL